MVTTLLERKKSITDRENAGPLPRCKECSSRNGEHITGKKKKSITDRENAGPLPRCKECSSGNGEHITGKKKVLKHITYMYSTHNRNKDL
jgi:cbb3-type cytochrome oxidase subunit 3